MARDSQDTKRRILQAATEEFAKQGIAGARVDRIAEKAGCNKSMLYAYFGDKDGLFDAVFSMLVEAILNEAPFDATDLAEYAGRLFDQTSRHPEVYRLFIWDQLERGGAGFRMPSLLSHNQHKIATLEKAQAGGDLSKTFSGVEWLALLSSICTMWTASPDLSGVASLDVQRRTVVEAVRILVKG